MHIIEEYMKRIQSIKRIKLDINHIDNNKEKYTAKDLNRLEKYINKFIEDEDDSEEFLPLNCFIHRYTDEGEGYLISFDGDEAQAFWVPVNQVDQNEEYEEGDFNTLYIKESWLRGKD